MAFKSRRQARYNALKDIGFLPFEARELSRLTIAEIRSTPYLRNFVRIRKSWLDEAPSFADHKRRVMEKYHQKAWLIPRGLYTIGNIWEWIHEIEEQYKKDHPDYETPPGRAGKKKRKKYVKWGIDY